MVGGYFFCLAKNRNKMPSKECFDFIYWQTLFWAPKLWCSQNRYIAVTIDLKYHRTPPVKLGEGFLFFKIWTKRGVIKKLLRNRGLVKRGGCLRKRDFPNCLVSFPQKSGKIVSSKNYFFRKACFHYCWNTIFFCLANIHTCCNQ